MNRLTADLSGLIGQKLTEEIEKDLEAKYEHVRFKQPGRIFTMEFRPGRLNVHLDKHGTITGVSFG